MTARAPLFGLVLAGGASTRMQRDKAALTYHDKPQLQWAWELLNELTEAAFVSVRPDQALEPLRAGLPQIVDRYEGIGPVAGILSALQAHPAAAFLVIACDLPFLDRRTLEHLIARRDPARVASAYRSARDGLPEPLCAIYEPQARAPIEAFVRSGRDCPRKFLIQSDALILGQPDPRALDNVNTPEEYRAATVAPGVARKTPEPGTIRTVRVQYYAVLREQAGRSEEQVSTAAANPADLYAELAGRYPFRLARNQLKVAINSEFGDWSANLQDGDSVVFIPPVAGG